MLDIDPGCWAPYINDKLSRWSAGKYPSLLSPYLPKKKKSAVPFSSHPINSHNQHSAPTIEEEDTALFMFLEDYYMMLHEIPILSDKHDQKTWLEIDRFCAKSCGRRGVCWNRHIGKQKHHYLRTYLFVERHHAAQLKLLWL